jgi:hypothetical protein
MKSRRLERLQTHIVLPTARSLYLAGSIICIAILVLALVAALFFELSSWRGAEQRPVPDLVDPGPASPGFDRIEQRLSGPSGLRFQVDLAAGSAPATGQLVGHFDANAPNGLAPYPNDFQIVGGRDAELFDTVYDGSAGRTGLTAKPSLSNAMAPAQGSGRARTFIVRVLARDAAGNRSLPANVSFTIDPSGRAPVATSEAPVTDLGGSGALPRVARAIASIVAPGAGTPQYFDAYKQALAEPQRCGAPSSDTFIDTYRRGFLQFRKRLNADNLSGFYAGLCEAWKDALDRHGQAVAQAEAARQQVILDNASAQLGAELRNAGARGLRNAALGFAFFALLGFMMIALFLAFLAIEGHSAAVRAAIEMLAARGEDRHDHPVAS